MKKSTRTTCHYIQITCHYIGFFESKLPITYITMNVVARSYVWVKDFEN